MIRHFINLSAGIEAIEREELVGDEVEFIRIASTDCEHKLGNPQWDAILCLRGYTHLPHRLTQEIPQCSKRSPTPAKQPSSAGWY